MKYYLAILVGIGVIFSGNAFAQYTPDVEIILTSSSYNFGEKLDYKIMVSEVTGEDAVIFITDTSGNKSRLLTMPISQEESRVIAPFGFDSVIWNEGKYELELQYSGAISNTEFTIVDDGSIGIPYWVKDLSKLWTSGQMPDREYANAIQFLIDEKIIFNPIIGQELQIPEWFKITTFWWANNQILDTEYGESLQYLINEKIIIIPINQESFNQEPSSDKDL
ncbi:MAG: hypothetical protein HOC53_04375 [Candidatus Nitrosopelagicus sp.]|jgi:hypothetical protein|nr:hypothetical protein [Candidatus Nitrosopelagicus sp.]MBT4325791.1 hypothetical protein [Candidatus Nitrosopelagicus sp.]MBT4455165.1 hypothetical protein [Candidatus Nitrosopelagicus sp.]MBT5171702.1 hypothetical protein [Candidatus Nitrosopelagicus sp.]MBT7252498.1 hypothetical protein [Candidatus Nitrosopelagicus sp.]|tara:strand:- start:259 stop:924 length:666 start_codon:yes stop_codon:yes gene_type:complete